jgi:hypothetical protein
MTIPDGSVWDKSREGRAGYFKAMYQTPVFVAILLLTGSLCLGLGLLVQKQNAQPKDPLWIEQLPAAALPGSISSIVNGGLPEAAPPKAAQNTATKTTNPSTQPAAAAAAVHTGGTYVASKTGTKYYIPSCATVKRIKDENKVWFTTKAEAEASGYQPASNCKGL